MSTKQPSFKTVALFFLVFGCQNSAFFAQQGLDETAFRTLSGAERFAFAQKAPFVEMDSATLAKAFTALQAIAEEVGDHRSYLALKYQQFLQRRKLKLSPDATLGLLEEMEYEAKLHGLEVERIVAHHFSVFEQYNLKKMRHEQLYVETLQEFERMDEMGFEKFSDYAITRLLFHSGRFMYDLEDFEKALQFLHVAERYIEPTEEGYQTYVHVLNYIQSIYQQQRDYSKGSEYAQKLLNFTRTFKTDDPDKRAFCQKWQGIASIDIASMLVGQQKFSEAERFANEGYQIIRKTDSTDLQTEYDALQVLVPTKLELDKMEEAASLLSRMEEILGSEGERDYYYFKKIRFYEAFTQYHEKRNDLSAAYRYAALAKPLQDSLERRNDARKFEKIQQRLEAEKYIQQLRLVESEKQLQTWLRNGAILLLVLVAALAFVNYRRLRHKRQLALLELEAAQKDLASFTQNLREKSELAENLRLEIDKLSAKGERSQYLEQLTNSTILTDEDWLKFRSVFEKVHPDFIAGQKTLHPDLTQAELRYLVLEKLQLSTHEMANMLGVSDGTIRQTRMRLRRKIGE